MPSIRTVLADTASHLARSLRSLAKEEQPVAPSRIEHVSVAESDLFDDEELGDISAEATALDDVLPNTDRVRAADAASDGFAGADEGESWMESMEQDVIESDIADKPLLIDEDGTTVGARKRSARRQDTPLADRGVAGRAGR